MYAEGERGRTEKTEKIPNQACTIDSSVERCVRHLLKRVQRYSVGCHVYSL